MDHLQKKTMNTLKHKARFPNRPSSRPSYLFTAAIPPDSCPECGSKKGFKDVTCYIPECGGPGSENIDRRL